MSPNECTNDIWKNTSTRFDYGCKVFAKNKKVAKVSKAVVEMTSMDEDDIGELLEAVPEELTVEELLEQERIAEEEARKKETAG